MTTPSHRSLRSVPKTVGMLLLLTLALPLNLVLTMTALLTSAFAASPSAPTSRPRTVLVSGGKMTKSLQLARSFHAAGHRVIMVESSKYRLTGHRFSRSVDRFYTVPKPTSPNYETALLSIVRREKVDVYVPVCSPAASYYDARAKAALSEYCEVVHCDPDMVRTLDDKYEFSVLAASLGLPVPDTYRISAAREVGDFDFDTVDGAYILKSIAYDPVNRMDLTTLPRSTAGQTAAFAHSKPISRDNPWIMQAMIQGREYCTHSTVRNGRVQAYCCCESSAFQINYEMVDKPAIKAWVTTFAESLNLTGQVSFDFIETPEGQLYAIECNPRTHSAITMFYDHPGLASAYLDTDVSIVTPLPTSRPTYWIYHEIWRLFTEPGKLARARTIVRGKDAIFDRADPLPFLMVHHVHIPWLLIKNLVQLKDWVRIDFNIGKLVESGGD
jgi:predicted ATP-grasp superfamily ATP-dependent carboligase